MNKVKFPNLSLIYKTCLFVQFYFRTPKNVIQFRTKVHIYAQKCNSNMPRTRSRQNMLRSGAQPQCGEVGPFKAHTALQTQSIVLLIKHKSHNILQTKKPTQSQNDSHVPMINQIIQDATIYGILYGAHVYKF